MKPIDIEKKPTEKPKKLFTAFDSWKYSLVAALVIIVIPAIFAAVMIIRKATAADSEQSLLGLIYVLSSGWFILLPIIPVLILARKDIMRKLKVFGRRSKVVILRMVGGDSNEIEVVLSLKGNTMEIGEEKFIINPRKATLKDGVKVMTYVANNALAHDFFMDQTKTLNKIASDLKSKKTSDFHDIFSDPIRVDAKYYQETFLAAQQTSPDILKKIISFLTSKSVLSILTAIAITSAVAAFLSLQANDLLNTVEFCKMGQLTP